VVAMLDEAITLEQEIKDPERAGRVVMLYCTASRLGSLEAQYRFGLFYLRGSGVPRNVAFAANLFSLAAQQGHAKAMDMLEKVNLRNIDLPACML
jgi:TPR repeat protein